MNQSRCYVIAPEGELKHRGIDEDIHGQEVEIVDAFHNGTIVFTVPSGNEYWLPVECIERRDTLTLTVDDWDTIENALEQEGRFKLLEKIQNQRNEIN